jgi:hypothetical protein
VGDYLGKARGKWVKNIKRMDIFLVDINYVDNEEEYISVS